MPPPTIERLETGIAGLDRFLGGGLPKRRAVLVYGESGTGKSILLNQFIYRGITDFTQPGVIVACEESPEAIRLNVGGFGWDYAALESGETRQLAFLDASPFQGELEMAEVDGQYSLAPLVDSIARAIEHIKAERVAIDGMASLFDRYRSELAVRKAFLLLAQRLGELGVTALISAPGSGGHSALSEHGLEEFLADGVMELTKQPGELRTTRRMIVQKLRGLSHQSGQVEFEITSSGLEVFPLIPLEERVANVDLDTRKAFGIQKFDEMLQGGLPEGHIALISGNTGAGKTLLALQFVREAGEASVYVTLEEASAQLRLVAGRFGWDPSAAEGRGELAFIDVPFSDIRPDQVLFQIVNAVQRIGARRLVFDSISALTAIGMPPRERRLFLEQLISFCKAQGITTLLNHVVGGAFGFPEEQAVTTGASPVSVVDAVILLRSVERQHDLDRKLRVVKLRGSGFDSKQHPYAITAEGLKIGEPLPEEA